MALWSVVNSYKSCAAKQRSHHETPHKQKNLTTKLLLDKCEKTHTRRPMKFAMTVSMQDSSLTSGSRSQNRPQHLPTRLSLQLMHAIPHAAGRRHERTRVSLLEGRLLLLPCRLHTGHGNALEGIDSPGCFCADRPRCCEAVVVPLPVCEHQQPSFLTNLVQSLCSLVKATNLPFVSRTHSL